MGDRSYERWPRSRLLRYSIALHVVGAGVLAWNPAVWPGVVSAIVLDHLLITAGSLWPRSSWVGPNLTRLPRDWIDSPSVALTFDDGPDPEVTPRVLELLARHDAKATFFCIGSKAERHPEVVRAVVDAGHRVENHSYAHHNSFCVRGPRALGRDLDRAQAVLSELAGSRPRFFRAPAGLRNPWLDAVLLSRGLELVSWTRRAFDTVVDDPARVSSRLIRGLSSGDVLLLHDGSSARDRRGGHVVLEALPRLLDELGRLGLRSIALPRPSPSP